MERLSAKSAAEQSSRKDEGDGATHDYVEKPDQVDCARISKGQVQFDPQDIDPLIDVIMRFSKAVADGAAQENLRLLAQVIAGLKKNKALADR
jgi:hypothetical protein